MVERLDTCPFCSVDPKRWTLSSDAAIAFLDGYPVAENHTLVIPKEPAETLLDLSSEAASDLINKVQVVAKAVKKAMNADGITVFQLNGAAAGQTVPHIHFHVLPGSLFGAKKHASTMSDPTELAEIAARIARELD